MPFIPCPEHAEVVLNYVRFGQKVKNVLHFLNSGAGAIDGAGLVDLAEAVRDAWSSHLRPLMTTSIALESVTAKAMDDEDSPAIEIALTTGNTGTGGVGTTLPNNVTLAMKKLTAFGGRSKKGRLYHPDFYSGNVITGNLVLEAARTGLIDAYTNFQSQIESTAPVFLSVVSRYHGVANQEVNGRYKRVPVPRAQGTSVLVIGWGADNILDSQRRRLPGRGD